MKKTFQIITALLLLSTTQASYSQQPIMCDVPNGVMWDITDNSGGIGPPQSRVYAILTIDFSSSAGTLIISGTGRMLDWGGVGPGGVPWSHGFAIPDLPDYIHTVIITEGVLNIGRHAFDGLPNLKSVSIPNSVTSIGDDAFTDNQLTSITIPSDVDLSSYGRSFPGDFYSFYYGKGGKQAGTYVLIGGSWDEEW